MGDKRRIQEETMGVHWNKAYYCMSEILNQNRDGGEIQELTISEDCHLLCHGR